MNFRGGPGVAGQVEREVQELRDWGVGWCLLGGGDNLLDD